MTRAMREVKDCLRDATMSLVHSGFTNENDVFAVEQWLLMETAALDASGSKRKHDNDSNNNSKGSKTNEGECNNKSTPPTLPIATPIRTTGHIDRQALTPQELLSGGNPIQRAQPDNTDGGTS